jgi:hypothetical protein
MLPCVIEDIIRYLLGLALELSSPLASLLPSMTIIATISPTPTSIIIVIASTLLRGDNRFHILLIIPHFYFVMYTIERKRMKVIGVNCKWVPVLVGVSSCHQRLK